LTRDLVQDIRRVGGVALALPRALAAAAVTWSLLLAAAPFAASRPAPAGPWYVFALLIYAAGSVVCHQLPERSFHLWSAQLPVCARCTGIYLGAAVAAVLAVIRLGPLNSSPRRLLTVAALPTLASLVYEWTTGDTPSNVVRAFAGAPLGAAVAFVMVHAVRKVN
jgi:uncharacterized membrane protein